MTLAKQILWSHRVVKDSERMTAFAKPTDNTVGTPAVPLTVFFPGEEAKGSLATMLADLCLKSFKPLDIDPL